MYDTCDPCSWEAEIERRERPLLDTIAKLQTELDLATDAGSNPGAGANGSGPWSERNAREAAWARRALDPGDTTAGADTDDAEPLRDLIAAGIAAMLHLGESLGARFDDLVIDGIRQWRRAVGAEGDQLWANREDPLVRCPDCGTDVKESKRWYEPCRSCRGRRGPRLGAWGRPSAAVDNERRAAWAEVAAHAFAARTGQFGPLSCTDTDQRVEVFADLLCNLRHLIAREGLDPDQVADGAREMWLAERADAALED